MIRCSCVSGSSGVNDAHVFISSGENVRLPCNNALHDCKSTTWLYNGFRDTATVELIGLGIKRKDTESHERLSLGSDCSLNIRNISTEDYGLYSCQQWTGVNRIQKHGPDAGVYLHVLHVSSSQTEISAGHSVTHCIITLNTTLLNEDDNREWRCEVTQIDQVKTSVTYTVKSSAQTNSTTSVIPVHSTHSQDPSTTNTHTTKGTSSLSSSHQCFTAALRYCFLLKSVSRYNEFLSEDIKRWSTESLTVHYQFEKRFICWFILSSEECERH
uniref:Ig-like domain-containing protein n=1 Tax=Cyprinus carpio TaxID=7962 RepID=A0A8C2HEC1_CYPCA